MTDYHIEVEEYGRKVRRIDVSRFAADLAAALGGKMRQETLPERDRDLDQIEVDGGLVLTVHANGYSYKGKVRVSSHPTDVVNGYPTDLAPKDRPPQHYSDDRMKMPDAMVSPDRPMATIAKDIRRRVIDAAAEPLAAIRAYVAQRQQARGNLAAVVAELAAKVPELVASLHSGTDAHDIPLFGSSGWYYMNVRAYASGEVGIDRIGILPLPVFIEVCEVIRRHVAGKRDFAA